MRKSILTLALALAAVTLAGCASTQPAPSSYRWSNVDGAGGRQIAEDATDKKIAPRNIGVLPLVDNAIAREAKIKKDSVEFNSNALETVLAKYPQEAYRLKVGKYIVQTTNPKTNKTLIKVDVFVKFDPLFITELKDALTKVSYKHLTNVDIDQWGHELDSKKHKTVGDESMVFLFSHSPNMLSNSIVNHAYYVNVGRYVADREDPIISKLAQIFSQASAPLLIQLIDAKGEVIDGTKSPIYDYAEPADNFMRAGATPLVLKSVYAQRFGQMQDLLWITDKAVKFDLTVELDNGQLNTATSLQAAFISY
jgi:hypothetical protein